MESSAPSTATSDATDSPPAGAEASQVTQDGTEPTRRSLIEGSAWPAQQLRAAVQQRMLTASSPIPERSFQPASLDLRLGPVAYRLRCSFLPGSRRVADVLPAYAMGTLDLRSGAVLDRNRPYLIPLLEEVNLPPSVRARVNPRSSTGRLDIFARLVTDGGEQFDDVAAGYRGPLYLEVVPRSFTIKVTEGLALSQLRLFTDDPDLDDIQLIDAHKNDPLLYTGADPVPLQDVRVRHGLFLSVDLSGDASPDRIVGYRAKKNSKLLDVSAQGEYDPQDFWEPITSEAGGVLVLEPEEFYLLYSRERVRIPRHLAAEMVAFDPSSGELRTHYAGFFDPGFGERPGAQQGAYAVLEVRAHDVPFAIAHGQRVSKLAFQRLKEPSATPYGPEIGSRYNTGTVVLLPRQFRSGPELQPGLREG
ncbi:MAG: 2'-deoxycytidine 5'-triphosphate deaminase [Chloroflexi bacterium]|nr:2'-deoxycytidine 5'-triphosphate deaminase [Chloroflexota bacterium]